MSYSGFIKFFKTPTGGALLLFAAIIIALLISTGLRKMKSADSEGATKAEILTETIGEATGIERTSMSTNVPEYVPAERKEPEPPKPVVTQKVTTAPSAPITLGRANSTTEEVIELSSNWLPFGTVMPCQLAFTVDSNNTDTPIIAQFTEDVYNNGERVIRAGDYLHGSAQRSRLRDRVASDSDWIIVRYDTSEQIPVTGIALDMARSNNAAKAWGLTDGSAGLRGTVVKSDKYAELKFFLAVALQGFAEGFNDTVITDEGTVISRGSLQNSLSQAAGDTLNLYARQQLQKLSGDLFFVRVPGATTFYFYNTQTIDFDTATTSVIGLNKK